MTNSPMNKKQRTRASSLVFVGLAAATVALAGSLGACELVTDFDRSLIPDAAVDDAGDLDVVTPPFDGSFDANLPTADGGSDASDASDATAADGATDAQSDAASDAADGDDGSADAADADAG